MEFEKFISSFRFKKMNHGEYTCSCTLETCCEHVHVHVGTANGELYGKLVFDIQGSK